MTSMAATGSGELYLTTYAPSSIQTQALFDKLSLSRSGLELFTSDKTPVFGRPFIYQERAVMNTEGDDQNIYYSNGAILVERIFDPNHPDMEGFFKIFRETITNDNERETDEEVRRYMQEYLETRKNPDRDYDEILLIAKVNSQVVAYTYLNYYQKHHLLFLNYLGSNRQDKSLSEHTTKALIEALQYLYLKELPQCKGLLYEIDATDPALTKEENDHRKARRRLFSGLVRKLGLKDYKIPINYIQPKVSILDGSSFEEVPMLLMYVPMSNSSNRTVLTKDELTSIIETTYLEWYGDIYESDPETQEQYLAYLEQIVSRFVNALPDRVALEG
jgi:hypothetical protein